MRGTSARPKTTERRTRRRAVLAVAAAVAIACAALALLLRTRTGPAARAGAAPNVILITLDTLRSDRLSCYGSKFVETPAIDAFAAEGVRFTNASSTVPLTLPAHASIMTGLYPPGHGVRENVGAVLGERIPTLAGLLGKGGWATAGFVSTFVLDHRWGIGRGFDRYADDFDGNALATAGAADMGSVRRDGAETVAAAVSWLDERPAGRPFFLWLHLYDPHDPYLPKEPFRSRHPGRPYDGAVAYTDSLVGAFRRALAERRLLEDALVVLTSDHGEGLGDHGETFHGFLVYDTTIHAALIVKTPRREGAGRVVERPVSHVDLLPTVLDLVGLGVPGTVHGRSLAPLIAGRDTAWDRAVYAESLYPLLHYGWAPLRALRTDRFKLIDAPRPELYDLGEDPLEGKDLHAADPKRARELTADLGRLRHRIEGARTAGGPAASVDERSVARLRSLGYLAGGGGVPVEKESERSREDPKDRLQLHQKVVDAQSRIAHREYDAARRLLEQVVAEDETIVDAHHMLGQIAADRGRPQDAIRHFKRALALNPRHERSLYDLASAYADAGRPDEALAGFRRVLELKGADARASLAIADLYVRLARFDEAAAELEKASGSAESAPFFANKLGEVRVAQGRTGEAATLFERAISLDAGFALPHFNLGVLLEKRGELRPAEERYARALQLEPGFFRAQSNLARLHASNGDPDGARRLWDAFLEANPRSVQARYFLAKLLMDTGGDLARAETLAREGIALDPEHAEGPLGYYVLADLLNRRGRTSEARAAAAKGREIQTAPK